jgi:hypothetical protein
MSLENLLKTGQLKPHKTDRKEIGRLLVAARRNLTDARADNISSENRFDAAYKCIMQCALMAPIQSLPKTIGLPGTRIAVLDTLRNKRNLSDYMGQEIDRASLASCVDEAERFMGELAAWLKATHPDLIP